MLGDEMLEGVGCATIIVVSIWESEIVEVVAVVKLAFGWLAVDKFEGTDDNVLVLGAVVGPVDQIPMNEYE